MSTPFEDSLVAALQARLAQGGWRFEPALLRREELAVDLPAGAPAVDQGDLAKAIAVALDNLLHESVMGNRGTS